MSEAAREFMERKIGIVKTQWNERFGSDADDTTALERKIGVRIGQWIVDFGGIQGSGEIVSSVSSDSTLVFADSTIYTADAA
jgi:hypothetical protein